MKRGEIYWANDMPTSGAEINKRRPWIIIGNPAIFRGRKTVLGIPLTTQGKYIPSFTVKIESQAQQALAVLDQLRAVAKDRFHERPIGVISTAELNEIEEGLKIQLCL